MYNPTILAIGAAFFTAVVNIWAKFLLKDLKARDLLGINFLMSAVILSLFSPLFYYFRPSLIAVSLIVLIGLIDSLANYFYFKTFEQSEASVATPILSLAPGFTFIFAWLFLGDVAPLKSLLLCFGIIILVVIFSSDFSDFHKFKKATLLPAIMSSLLFGISAIPSKYLLSNLHSTNALTLYMLRAAFISAFSFLFFKASVLNLKITHYKQIFFRSLLVIAQWGLLYSALTYGHAGVTITLANITPVFVFILAILFLKERFTWKKIIASGLILAFSLMI